jgi:hypothetical protein
LYAGFVLALSLLLAASTAVGIKLEQAVDVPPDRAEAIVAAIADAIDQREDLDASAVVVLRLFGAVTRLRIVAQAHFSDASEPIVIEQDITEDDPRPQIEELVARLFPIRSEPINEPEPEPQLNREAPNFVLPISFVSVSAVALGAGIALGVTSRSARNASQDPDLGDEEFSYLAHRTRDFAIAADVVFAVAGTAFLVGAIFFLLEL